MPGGGGWNGLNNVPTAMLPSSAEYRRRQRRDSVRIPHQPTLPPAPHGPTVIAVNTKPLTGSEIASSTSFVFRKDSAGLGVPRGTLGDLRKFSNESISKGAATMPIFTERSDRQRADGAIDDRRRRWGNRFIAGSPPPTSASLLPGIIEYGASNSSGWDRRRRAGRQWPRQRESGSLGSCLRRWCKKIAARVCTAERPLCAPHCWLNAMGVRVTDGHPPCKKSTISCVQTVGIGENK